MADLMDGYAWRYERDMRDLGKQTYYLMTAPHWKPQKLPSFDDIINAFLVKLHKGQEESAESKKQTLESLEKELGMEAGE